VAKPFDQDAAREVLNELHHLLLGTSPFLIQGTALGAYRDEGFTPFADDIDIGFLQEDFNLFGKNIALRLIGRGFEIRTVNAPFTRCRSIKAVRDGIKIDLNGYMLWNDARFVCNSDTAAGSYAVVYDRKLIEKTQTIKLFGRDWQIPSPVEEYLAHEYGETWRTPSRSNVSACRVYNYLTKENIPTTLLD
jgi:hypothetical protein